MRTLFSLFGLSSPAPVRKLLQRFSASIFGPKTRRKIFAAATADAPLALRQKS
ncbi:hypothetical protein [Campylobacter magnus]|uniref:hypothetical protein n=1 Tax=Campylobacter magnus TaxID=3026462 RepID=UPI0026DED768|nr:hypothetical protein [Campylobacter magnus]MDO2408050.1 hypothetical protein [Campylobacter magnus]